MHDPELSGPGAAAAEPVVRAREGRACPSLRPALVGLGAAAALGTLAALAWVGAVVGLLPIGRAHAALLAWLGWPAAWLVGFAGAWLGSGRLAPPEPGGRAGRAARRSAARRRALGLHRALGASLGLWLFVVAASGASSLLVPRWASWAEPGLRATGPRPPLELGCDALAELLSAEPAGSVYPATSRRPFVDVYLPVEPEPIRLALSADGCRRLSPGAQTALDAIAGLHAHLSLRARPLGAALVAVLGLGWLVAVLSGLGFRARGLGRLGAATRAPSGARPRAWHRALAPWAAAAGAVVVLTGIWLASLPLALGGAALGLYDGDAEAMAAELYDPPIPPLGRGPAEVRGESWVEGLGLAQQRASLGDHGRLERLDWTWLERAPAPAPTDDAAALQLTFFFDHPLDLDHEDTVVVALVAGAVGPGGSVEVWTGPPSPAAAHPFGGRIARAFGTLHFGTFGLGLDAADDLVTTAWWIGGAGLAALAGLGLWLQCPGRAGRPGLVERWAELQLGLAAAWLPACLALVPLAWLGALGPDPAARASGALWLTWLLIGLGLSSLAWTRGRAAAVRASAAGVLGLAAAAAASDLGLGLLGARPLTTGALRVDLCLALAAVAAWRATRAHRGEFLGRPRP